VQTDAEGDGVLDDVEIVDELDDAARTELVPEFGEALFESDGHLGRGPLSPNMMAFALPGVGAARST
jgi:hypothetical protein